MKITATEEKGIAIILSEEEVKTIINLSLPGIQTESREVRVKQEDPLKGFHRNYRDFITSLYNRFGIGEIVRFDNEYFKELRRSLFILSSMQSLQKLHGREVVELDIKNKTFMFMKSPLVK